MTTGMLFFKRCKQALLAFRTKSLGQSMLWGEQFCGSLFLYANMKNADIYIPNSNCLLPLSNLHVLQLFFPRNIA